MASCVPVISIDELNTVLEAIVRHCNSQKKCDYISVAYEDLRRWTFMGLCAEYIEVRLSPNQRHIVIEMLLPVKTLITCRGRYRGSLLETIRRAMSQLFMQAKDKIVND